jgi:cytoskeleton protein RodZ
MIRVMEQNAAAIAGTKWTRALVGFGQELRHERERLGVPLEALAEATKVPVRNLRALESDDWAELPGGVFTKGIVRGYCKFLGLPEHQWMDRLAVSWEQAAGEQDWTEFAQAVKRNRVQASPVVRRRWWGVAGMLLALLVLAWAAWHYVLRDRMPSHFDWPGKTKSVQAEPLPEPAPRS